MAEVEEPIEEVVEETIDVMNFLDKENADTIFRGIKDYILAHSGGSSGSGEARPDGDYVINRDDNGDVLSIVFTGTGGTSITTTFVETDESKYVVTRTVEPDAKQATIVTIVISNDGNSIRQRTTYEDIE